MEITVEKLTEIVNKAVNDVVLIKEKDWWQKKDIATIFGVSERAIERMLKQPGAPQYKILKGTKKTKIYRPVEVNRFIAS